MNELGLDLETWHSRECRACGQPIPPGRPDRRHGGDACRLRAWRKRQRVTASRPKAWLVRASSAASPTVEVFVRTLPSSRLPDDGLCESCTGLRSLLGDPIIVEQARAHTGTANPAWRTASYAETTSNPTTSGTTTRSPPAEPLRARQSVPAAMKSCNWRRESPTRIPACTEHQRRRCRGWTRGRDSRSSGYALDTMA